MGNSSDQTFFKKIYTKIQQLYEEILKKSTDHHRNANQNHSEISSDPCWTIYYQKTTNVGKDKEKEEISYTGRNIN